MGSRRGEWWASWRYSGRRASRLNDDRGYMDSRRRCHAPEPCVSVCGVRVCMGVPHERYCVCEHMLWGGMQRRVLLLLLLLQLYYYHYY